MSTNLVALKLPYVRNRIFFKYVYLHDTGYNYSRSNMYTPFVRLL